jgi:hypothetical protein
VRLFQRAPRREHVCPGGGAELKVRDAAGDRDRIRRRVEEKFPQRDRVAPVVLGTVAPVVEDSVGFERVPAAKLGADAEREVLDVADPVHGVVAPVEIVVADEGLAAVAADLAHGAQEVMRLPLTLPAVLLRREVDAARRGQGGLMREECVRVTVPLPPRGQHAQAGAHLAAFLDHETHQPVALREAAEAAAARAGFRRAELAAGIEPEEEERLNLGKIGEEPREQIAIKFLHLRVAEAQHLALVGAGVAEHLGGKAREELRALGLGDPRSALAGQLGQPEHRAEPVVVAVVEQPAQGRRGWRRPPPDRRPAEKPGW